MVASHVFLFFVCLQHYLMPCAGSPPPRLRTFLSVVCAMVCEALLVVNRVACPSFSVSLSLSRARVDLLVLPLPLTMVGFLLAPVSGRRRVVPHGRTVGGALEDQGVERAT